ncbi:Env9p [Sugiyamaella lignohabitans]|uniref:Env9p n=1 Tax=Sugiyamaella lignohabitans TaxID=796027 RepID=A0A167DUZ8_9ASCO|nr:Env9p [Sugiyamaella lignohabitans]ANB13323.1 Env9p [Sugiyamaella lignohabitans]
MNLLRTLKDFVPYRVNYSVEQFPDLTGKVYIVTGASGGLGLQVGKKLLQKNAKVYFVAKTEPKLVAAIEKLKEEFPDKTENIHYLLCDYGDLSTIKPATDKFLAENDRLDGIVHNAGMNFAGPDSKTAQGHELTVGVNGIAPHLFQKYVDEILEKTAQTAPANSVRIVWVSSSAHRLSPVGNGGLQLDDMNNVADGLLKLGRYSHSKTVNYYQGVLWPIFHKGSKVISVSVHPGLVGTDIGRNVGMDSNSILHTISYTPEKASYAELYPLLHPSITTSDNGNFYVPFGQAEHPRQDVFDGAHGEFGLKVWAWLEEQVKDFV